MNGDPKTGTTTIGLVCKEGIILAADRRVSAGYLIAKKDYEKVVPITDNIAVTIAGSVSDIQMVIKIIKAQIRLNKFRSGKEPLVREMANLLMTMVYGNIRRMTMIPSITAFLVGGFDNTGSHLFEISPAGSIIEFDDYVTDGSGSVFALGVLEANYKKDLSLQEGIKLALKALNAAMQRDMASGNGVDIYAITKEGAKKVFEKQIDTNLVI
ncbi:proteasome subunit beta [Candidatus Woesearchaeota archaeon]|nr:proteasome subunit beta [Candidatus Woesearchaeota archaeon]